jgi:penicillin amidase
MATHWTLRGEGPIRIRRDVHGVPHVRAASEADLYRGLGHCHGRDRALQLVLTRILARGRTSEILDPGEEMLAVDRFFRRMNFGGDTEDEVAKLASADRALAEAYCDGVNRALQRRPPWEVRLLGHRPEPWSVADTILISRVIGYVSLAQSQADMERLLVEMVQAGVPRAHLEELFQGLLGGFDAELLAKVRLGDRLIPAGVRWSRVLPRMLASNAWAVAPRKTARGSALLAGDPHLDVHRLPPLWYESVLEGDGRACLAATVPGVPALILGRTDDLAWAPTYSYMDSIDAWIEDCRDGCYRRVLDGRDAWLPFRERHEVLRRKGRPDVVVTFHENDHGVLDGDPREEGLRLAWRWSVSAGTGAASLSGALAILRARTVGEGMEALRRIETAWNFVLADRHGSIGFQMSGLMPRRGSGSRSFVPLPGWDPENDWCGFVPAEELPSALNPPSGFVASANDALNLEGASAHPVNLPLAPYRAERIHELLASRDDWTPEGFQLMQLDLESVQARRFMEVLRPLLPESEAGEVLRGWDCRYEPGSRGAALFEHCYRTLLQDIFGSVCGEEVLRFLAEETPILTNFFYNFDRVLLAEESVWFGPEGRDARLRRVLRSALAGAAPGATPRQEIVMKHVLFGDRLPAWLGFDHGPVALPGSRATLRQGEVFRTAGREQSFAPSYRFVTDLAERWAYTALAGGLSDRRFSRWYRRGIEDWAAGRSKRVELGPPSAAGRALRAPAAP